MASHLGLLLLGDLAAHPGVLLGLLAASFAALVLAAGPPGTGTGPAWNPATILAVAALLRLLLLPLQPTLSNDILRYLWDGRLVSHGYNPYLLPPEAPELAPLRDELWQGLHHRDVPTVYPPFAMALFGAVARLPLAVPGQVIALKGVLTVADLAACWLLVYIARLRRLPLSRTVAYAWNPLVTLEVAGMGHVDALGVAAVVATVALLLRRRPAAAGLAASAGVLAKLAPLPLLPMWSRQSGRPLRFLATGTLVLAATVLPLLLAARGVPPGLLIYGVSWEFNGPVFEPLWRLLELLQVPVLVAATLDHLKAASGYHAWWNQLYPYNYPQLLAKLLLAGGMAAWLVASLARGQRLQGTNPWQLDPVAGTGRLLGGLLLLSATVYPWYLLWVLPWAALGRRSAWLVLAALMPLSYLPQLTGVPLVPWVYLAIWLPFAILCLYFRPRPQD